MRLSNITFAYSDVAILRSVTFTLRPGSFNLVVGSTGAGKSTLLKIMASLAPEHTGGVLQGSIPRTGQSAYVPQDAPSSFVRTTVEEELAFSMEQRGVDPEVMRIRMESTLDLIGLAELRSRPLSSLSGGQQQKVAIAAAIITSPSYLILDEPTSQLDPKSADEVLAVLRMLVHDLGMTVVLAEHRLERVLHMVEDVLYIRDGQVHPYPSVSAFYATETSAPAPPVVELGRLVPGMQKAVSVRDARAAWGDWFAESPGLERLLSKRRDQHERADCLEFRHLDRDPLAAERGLRVKKFTVFPHYTTVIVGRNGSGKSTLLHAISQSKSAAAEPIRLVPQNASDLLYNFTVEKELQATTNPVLAKGMFHQLTGLGHYEQNPRDLSAGQQLALALAIQLSVWPKVILLDEPTRGLDYAAKHQLVKWLREFKKHSAIVIATHDMEFAALVADEIVSMARMDLVHRPLTPHQMFDATGNSATQIARVTNGLFISLDEYKQSIDLILRRDDPSLRHTSRSGSVPLAFDGSVD